MYVQGMCHQNSDKHHHIDLHCNENQSGIFVLALCFKLVFCLGIYIS